MKQEVSIVPPDITFYAFVHRQDRIGNFSIYHLLFFALQISKLSIELNSFYKCYSSVVIFQNSIVIIKLSLVLVKLLLACKPCIYLQLTNC